MNRNILIASVLFTTVLSACEVRSFPFVTEGDDPNNPGDKGDAFVFRPGEGGSFGNGTNGDALPPVPDGAVRRPDGGLCVIVDEQCNGADDDCDGVIDNGFDLQTNAGNCGRCGSVCQLEHAFPACVAGVCKVQDCLPGWFDTDKNVANGCECLKSNGGVELCDGADNDCDGQVDEDFAFPTDKNNCGKCGVTCEFPHAAAACDTGLCVMGTCEPGFINLNAGANDKDGCEYSCTPTADPTERCDGVDNDCNGGIDNAPIDEGAACPDANVTVCKRGIVTCTSGKLICVGATQPGIEFCDGTDNDCDGSTDEGFNKQSDIRYCGNCQPCAIPNAVPRCNQGTCEIEVCSPGYTNLDPNVPGCEYACTFTGIDVCNSRDDDCDGMTDEGIDKTTDTNNCGACGNVCRFPNAQPICSATGCMQGSCNNNFHDLNPNAAGCEYFCVRTGAVEMCDNVDNDCNGQTDEGYNTTTDVNNCGQCGNQCRFTNAAATCTQNGCEMGGCSPGFVNTDNQTGNGCEYQCTPSNGGVEICDGLDNNCDTRIDETDPQLNANCFPQGETGCDPTAGTCAGICQLGRFACLGGQLACQNYQLQQAEFCDNVDNDCDGGTDEDFDKDNDPRFCGGCRTQCSFTNAVALCVDRGCEMGPCHTGFVDLNGDMNGCEYACKPTGPEVCDGADNDCDGLTDSADNNAAPLLAPQTNFCRTVGLCAGASPQCVQLAGMTQPDWVCNYPATVQTSAPNVIIPQETLCDGLDNDCDAAVDEHVPTVGTTCTDTGVGECRRIGAIACVPGNAAAAPTCQYAAAALTAQHELCDNKDNDCDGRTDEIWDDPTGTRCGGNGPCLGIRDSVVTVSAAGYNIYQFEASRPDASNTSQGALATRACSVTNKKPWTSVTYVQAQAACASAGKRLCRTNRTTCASMVAINPANDEFGLACASGRTCNASQPTFPYGCSYATQTCNGNDNSQQSIATGSKVNCTTNDLDTANGTQVAFDMSGNVSEWTDDCGGMLPDGRNIYTLRGGDYLSGFFSGVGSALECDFYQVQVAANYSHPSTGFRCCTTCAAGLAECNGMCLNLANHNGNCGACGNACSNGATCLNGVCTN